MKHVISLLAGLSLGSGFALGAVVEKTSPHFRKGDPTVRIQTKNVLIEKKAAGASKADKNLLVRLAQTDEIFKDQPKRMKAEEFNTALKKISDMKISLIDGDSLISTDKGIEQILQGIISLSKSTIDGEKTHAFNQYLCLQSFINTVNSKKTWSPLEQDFLSSGLKHLYISRYDAKSEQKFGALSYEPDQRASIFSLTSLMTQKIQSGTADFVEAYKSGLETILGTSNPETTREVVDETIRCSI